MFRWIVDLNRNTSSFNLSIFRATYCISIAVVHWFRYDSFFESYFKLGNYDILFFDYYQLEIFGMQGYYILRAILLLFLFMAGFGVLTRISLILSALVFFLYEYPICHYINLHTTPIVLITLILLSISPGVSFISVDTRLGKKSNPLTPMWTYKAIMLNLALVYFSAFCAKMVNTGFSWGNGHHLSNYIIEQALASNNSIGFWAASHLTFMRFISIFTLFFEASFLLTLFNRLWLRLLYVVVALCFHIGVGFLMDIYFILIFSYVYFI